MSKKDVAISYSELMKELDKYRTITTRALKLTDEQKKFLIKARNHKCPVPYKTLAGLWEKLGWGKIGKGSIRLRAEKAMKENM